MQNIEDSKNDTQTHFEFTIQKEHPNTIKFLIKQGDSYTEKNKEGKNALMLAIEQGSEEDVIFLIDQGAPLNEQDDNGNTALMLAYTKFCEAFKKYREECEYIDECISDHNLLHDTEYHYDPSDYPKPPSQNIIYTLLAKGADLNLQDQDGYTMLMFTVISENNVLFEELCKRGASLAIKNKNGKTAEDLAIGAGYTIHNTDGRWELKEKPRAFRSPFSYTTPLFVLNALKHPVPETDPDQMSLNPLRGWVNRYK